MSVVPIEDVWVIANFKETQVNEIKVGQNVKVKIDAYSDYELTVKYYLIPTSASSFSLIHLKMLQEILLKSFENSC